MNKSLTLSAMLIALISVAPVAASANYVEERYHDRSPPEENDIILGKMFVDSISSVLN